MIADTLDTLSLRPSVREALAEARAELKRLYGDRLVKVILYGSQARGEATAESDVDVLVVLRGEVKVYEEIKRTADLPLEISLKHHEALSLLPISQARYLDPHHPLMMNVNVEGIEL